MLANNEAIYGTQPIRIDAPKGVYLSQKTVEGKHYMYIFMAQPISQITLAVNGTGDCKVLETGQPITYKNYGEAVCLDIPENLFKDSSLQVLKLGIK